MNARLIIAPSWLGVCTAGQNNKGFNRWPLFSSSSFCFVYKLIPHMQYTPRQYFFFANFELPFYYITTESINHGGEIKIKNTPLMRINAHVQLGTTWQKTCRSFLPRKRWIIQFFFLYYYWLIKWGHRALRYVYKLRVWIYDAIIIITVNWIWKVMQNI